MVGCEAVVRLSRLDDEHLVELALTGHVAAAAELHHRYVAVALIEVRRRDRNADMIAVVDQAFRDAYDIARTARAQATGFAEAVLASIAAQTTPRPHLELAGQSSRRRKIIGNVRSLSRAA